MRTANYIYSSVRYYFLSCSRQPMNHHPHFKDEAKAQRNNIPQSQAGRSRSHFRAQLLTQQVPSRIQCHCLATELHLTQLCLVMFNYIARYPV